MTTATLDRAQQKASTLADLERRAENGYRLAMQSWDAGDATKARKALEMMYYRLKQHAYLSTRPLDAPCPLCAFDAGAVQATLEAGGVVWLCVDHMRGQLEHEVARMLEDHDGLHDGVAVYTGVQP